MIDSAPAPSSAIPNIASILQAIAWPVVAALFFLIFKSRIFALLDVLTKKIEAATRLKLWQLEIETAEQNVKAAVERVGRTAGSETLESRAPEVPETQVKAAKEVNDMLLASPLSGERGVELALRQMHFLADEYDDLRDRMPRGASRTRAMNEIVAKMRALSLASRHELRSFMSGSSAGDRLAAICILQVVPEFGFFRWLVERLKTEDQPFILFHSAVAILSLVKTKTYNDPDVIRRGINDALQHVNSFKDGTPDKGTIAALNQALEMVR